MTDAEIMEQCRNNQLNDHLNNYRSGEENWIACENYVYLEVEEIRDLLSQIVANAYNNYNIDKADCKDMLIDAIKDII